MATSALTLGAGLFTDMIGDAIYDSNTEKAKAKGKSVQELYDDGEDEFLVPLTVGAIGGKFESMGIKGVGKFINGATKGFKKSAAIMLNNSGKEGLTEWLQFGLENGEYSSRSRR